MKPFDVKDIEKPFKIIPGQLTVYNKMINDQSKLTHEQIKNLLENAKPDENSKEVYD